MPIIHELKSIKSYEIEISHLNSELRALRKRMEPVQRSWDLLKSDMDIERDVNSKKDEVNARVIMSELQKKFTPLDAKHKRLANEIKAVEAEILDYHGKVNRLRQEKRAGKKVSKELLARLFSLTNLEWEPADNNRVRSIVLPEDTAEKIASNMESVGFKGATCLKSPLDEKFHVFIPKGIAIQTIVKSDFQPKHAETLAFKLNASKSDDKGLIEAKKIRCVIMKQAKISTQLMSAVKNFGKADEVREFPNGRVELVRIGGITIGRAILQPGWRWSTCLKPIAKTRSCDAPHFQYHISGVLKVRMDDGNEYDCGPGDVAVFPSGHDAWVVGDEPVVIVDFQGMMDFAKPKT